MKELLYGEAINEALHQIFLSNPNALCYGIDVNDAKKILSCTKGLSEKFGKARCFSTPLAEESLMGIGIGMSMAGMLPINIHIRSDFLQVCMNQIVNHLSRIHYYTGGQISLPMIVKTCTGISWGQGPQHSASNLSILASYPGIKVLAPAFPYDAKACYLWAAQQQNPVFVCENRLCYYQKGSVPESPEFKPHRILHQGNDIVLVANSFMAIECLRAAEHLKEVGIEAEVVNVIDQSDMSWAEKYQGWKGVVVPNDYAESYLPMKWARQLDYLNYDFIDPTPILGWPFCPCPTTPSLEKAFYQNAETIAKAAYQRVTGKSDWEPTKKETIEGVEFRGPF